MLNIKKLNMNSKKYESLNKADIDHAYVLINPPSDFLLQPDDIIYLLKPGNSE